jgi:hypothetical protein
VTVEGHAESELPSPRRRPGGGTAWDQAIFGFRVWACLRASKFGPGDSELRYLGWVGPATFEWRFDVERIVAFEALLILAGGLGLRGSDC